jgi:cytochrome c553
MPLLRAARVAVVAAAALLGANGASAQDAARGAALYRTLPGAPAVGSCFSCHGEPLNNRNSVLRGAVGGSLISRTINAVGAMGYLRQYLSEADLADIAAYLATVVPPVALEELPEPWPTFDDFGSVIVGTQARERVVFIRNLQPRADIAVGSVVSSNPTVFPVQHECPLSLPPLAQCRVRTWFAPQAAGAAEARFDIVTPSGQVLRSGRLLGTGVEQPPAQLAWTPALGLIDFGRVAVGHSATVVFQLSNTGAQPAQLQRLRITGPQALRFSLSAPCVAAGRIEPAASCEVTLSHTPRVAERAEGWVELASDASNAPLLRVQAIGVAPEAEVPSPPPAASEPAPMADTGGGAISAPWLLGLALAVCWLRRSRRADSQLTHSLPPGD